MTVTVLVSIHSGFRMWTIPAESVDWLRAQFPDHRFLHARNDQEGLQLIAEADAAFSGYVHPAELQAARRLRWIHTPSAGVGHLTPSASRERSQVVGFAARPVRLAVPQQDQGVHVPGSHYVGGISR